MKKLILGFLLIATTVTINNNIAFASETQYICQDYDCLKQTGCETKCNDFYIPNCEIPNIEILNIVIPNYEIPNYVVPNYEIPKYEIPSVEIPKYEVPNYEIPSIELPNIVIPDIEIPNIDIPNFEVPNIVIPDGTIPDTLILDTISDLFKNGAENAKNNAELYKGYRGIYDFRTVESNDDHNNKQDAQYVVPITGDIVNINYDEVTGITETYVESKRNDNPSIRTKSFPDNKLEATIIADGDICLGNDGSINWGIIIGDENSSVNIELKNSSMVAYTINGDSKAQNIALFIDKTSQWYVTGTSYINELVIEDNNLSNIVDNGNTIYYDNTKAKNSWLEGKTILLNGGGKLVPISEK